MIEPWFECRVYFWETLLYSMIYHIFLEFNNFSKNFMPLGAVLGVLIFTKECQMEPLAPNAISYDTSPTVKFYQLIWSSIPSGLV